MRAELEARRYKAQCEELQAQLDELRKKYEKLEDQIESYREEEFHKDMYIRELKEYIRKLDEEMDALLARKCG